MNTEHARKILEQAHDSGEINFPLTLVSEIHDIELEYLFERNEDKPINLIKQVVENYIGDGDTKN